MKKGETGMSDIRDYLKWRGDLSFAERKWNDVDNIVFCFFNYIDLTPLNETEGKNIETCIHELQEKQAVKFQITDVGSSDDPFLDLIADSKRFGKITVHHYADIHDYASSLQFSASAYLLPDNTRVICYRGTDESMEGWKEDFDISYHVTLAQKKAAAYLQEELKKPGNVYVCGHSKGGNLALYAVSCLKKEEHERILHVYDNDGPGLSRDIVNLALLDEMKDKITLIQPAFSIFGNIFPYDAGTKIIVQSSKTGVLEHDPSSWQINGDSFVTAPVFDYRSVLINQAMDQWISDKDLSVRRSFVNNVFAAMEDHKIRDIDDIRRNPQRVLKILSDLTGEKLTRKVALDLPKKLLFADLFKDFEEDGFLVFIQKHALLRNLLLVITGWFVMALNDHILSILALIFPLVFFSLEIAALVTSLYKEHWDWKKEKARLWMCTIAAVFLISVAFKADARTFLGSELMGIACLITANTKLGKIQNTSKFVSFFRIFEFVCWGISGAFFLLANADILYFAAKVIGVYMMFVGVINCLISFMHKQY